MPLVDLVMPKMGESIMEATILKWLKQPGDTVRQDETLLEIATDKVDSEVPSVTAGTLEEILFQVNDVVPIGSVIARIRTSSTSSKDGSSADDPPKINHPLQPQYHPQTSSNGTGNRFYSPLVLNIAASEGVPLNELESIPGTGNEGRVTKKDILQYIADRKTGTAPARPLPTTISVESTPAAYTT